jgi:hypothetical protein
MHHAVLFCTSPVSQNNRDRHTDTQTDRQTDRQTDKHINTQTHRRTDTRDKDTDAEMLMICTLHPFPPDTHPLIHPPTTPLSAGDGWSSNQLAASVRRFAQKGSLPSASAYDMACRMFSELGWVAWQGPLETLATSHGPVTRRRLESLWRTQPMRSRLPARESW